MPKPLQSAFQSSAQISYPSDSECAATLGGPIEALRTELSVVVADFNSTRERVSAKTSGVRDRHLALLDPALDQVNRVPASPYFSMGNVSSS
jgi:hypothetical protein